jgi:hypothetical protein
VTTPPRLRPLDDASTTDPQTTIFPESPHGLLSPTETVPPFHSRHKPYVSRSSRTPSKFSHANRPSTHFPDDITEGPPLDTMFSYSRSSGHHPPSPSSRRFKVTMPRQVPDYISPVHHPSTNPSFALDFRSRTVLPPWTDRTADHVTVHLWAKLFPPGSTKGKGKGKAPEEDLVEPQWKLLEEWLIDLTDLVPLPEEVCPLTFLVGFPFMSLRRSFCNGRHECHSTLSFFRSRLPAICSIFPRPRQGQHARLRQQQHTALTRKRPVSRTPSEPVRGLGQENRYQQSRAGMLSSLPLNQNESHAIEHRQPAGRTS